MNICFVTELLIHYKKAVGNAKDARQLQWSAQAAYNLPLR